MASPGSIAARSQLAREGIQRELARFAASTGQEVALAPVQERDPALRTAKELEAIHEMLRQLNDGVEAATAGAGGIDPSALDGNIASVREYLAGIDSPDALAMLHAAEMGGKTRKGVLSIIEARQAEVEADDGDEEPDEV
jgi:hypothetical protein